MRAQVLEEPGDAGTHYVLQSVVAFPSVADAAAFFTASSLSSASLFGEHLGYVRLVMPRALITVHQCVIGIETDRRRQRRRSRSIRRTTSSRCGRTAGKSELWWVATPYPLAGRIGAGLRLDQIGAVSPWR